MGGKLRFLCEKVQRNGGFGKKLSILGLFTGIPMFKIRLKFDLSKFSWFVGSIKVGSVRSKFGKDEVQTALAGAMVSSPLLDWLVRV